MFLGFPCSEVETNGRGRRRSGGRSVRPLSVHPLRTDLYATRQPQSPRPARVRTNAALQLPDLLHLFLAQKQRHSTLGQEAQRQNERFFFIAPPLLLLLLLLPPLPRDQEQCELASRVYCGSSRGGPILRSTTCCSFDLGRGGGQKTDTVQKKYIVYYIYMDVEKEFRFHCVFTSIN